MIEGTNGGRDGEPGAKWERGWGRQGECHIQFIRTNLARHLGCTSGCQDGRPSTSGPAGSWLSRCHCVPTRTKILSLFPLLFSSRFLCFIRLSLSFYSARIVSSFFPVNFSFVSRWCVRQCIGIRVKVSRKIPKYAYLLYRNINLLDYAFSHMNYSQEIMVFARNFVY